MKILKIKDNVDLKELEKFGFIKTTIIEGVCDGNSNWADIKDVYCLLQEYPDISDRGVESYDVNCFFDKNNKLSFCSYPEQIDWRKILNVLYDLIQAGLVEKVEEK